MRSKKKSVYYVNNSEMYAAIVDHRARVTEALAAGRPAPPIPESVGRDFMLIAQKMATRWNFKKYTYIQEMVNDAIECCVLYYFTFDPNKSDKPFSFFTKSVWNAFLRRIEKEEKLKYARINYTRHALIFNELSTGDGSLQIETTTAKMMLESPATSDFIEKYERGLARRKAKDEAKKAARLAQANTLPMDDDDVA